MKSLIILGENVKISRLPKFLDSKAIKFLFNTTKFKISLDDLTEKSKELLTKRKERIISKERQSPGPLAPIVKPNKSMSRKSSAPSIGSSRISMMNPFTSMSKKANPNSRMSQVKEKDEILK